MKDDPIPELHHVSRYCGFTTLKSDGFPSGTAFRLFPKDQELLSVNWLEHLELGGRDAEIAEVLSVLTRKMKKLGAQAKLAVLNVGQSRQFVQASAPDGRVLAFRHDPEVNPVPDPSHSGIVGMRLEDDLIADLVALTVREVHPTK